MNSRSYFSTAKSTAKKLRRRAERALSLDVDNYQGLPLPPGYLRSCGHRFRDNAHFVDTAKGEAKQLIDYFGLNPTSDVLDIGCGAGRLPIGLIASEIKVRQYVGVEINADAIRWCKKYITKISPNFVFHVTHAAHRKYNPEGTPVDDSFTLPFKDKSFDLIYLGGVFAVMDPYDVFVYCKEMNRLLREDGNVFLTAFIEENVPPFEESPKNYKVKNIGPLTIARYSRENFYSIVERAGLKVEAFDYEGGLDEQSVVHLRHA